MIVRRRPLAAEDIAGVWNHIADDSLRAADRWVDQLNEQFQLLATQPLMGRARDALSSGLRSFPFGRYVIFYETIEGGIDVVRRHRQAVGDGDGRRLILAATSIQCMYALRVGPRQSLDESEEASGLVRGGEVSLLR